MHSGQRFTLTGLRRAWVSLCLVGSASLAMGAEISGVPQVVDGDTLTVEGQTLRLAGVDAPARDQPCYSPDEWECGEGAAQALAGLVNQQIVLCTVTEESDTPSAVCSLEERELNAWMVTHGWGLAASAPGPYTHLEEQAAVAKRGLWLGGFEPTAVWKAWVAGTLNPDDFSCGVCAARKHHIKDNP